MDLYTIILKKRKKTNKSVTDLEVDFCSALLRINSDCTKVTACTQMYSNLKIWNQELQMYENMQHLSFWICDVSFIMNFSSFIHFPANLISIFFTAGQHSILSVYYIFIIHLSLEGYLGCFNFLAVMTRTSMNLVEQVCVEQVLSPLGICQGLVQLCHMVDLFLTIEDSLH